MDECDDRDEVARRAALGGALHDRLVAALRRERPDALAAAEAELAAPKSLWARVTGADKAEEPAAAAGFSFGFSGEAPPAKRPKEAAFSFGFG